MARGFNGTTDKITYTGSAAPGGVYPYTAACWFLLTSAPGAANQNIFVIYSVGGAVIDNIGLSTDHTSGKFNPFVTDSAGGADTSILVGTALAANTWYFGAITGTSSTVRTGYLWQGGSLVSANGD